MFPTLTEDLVRERIETLHREAAAQRWAAQLRRDSRGEAGGRPGAVRQAAGRALMAAGCRLAGVAGVAGARPSR